MPHETPSQPREVRTPDPPRRRAVRRPAGSTLAAFELLAPPETIAGGAPVAEAPNSRRGPKEEAEIARLRADLDRQGRELDALRQRLEISPAGVGPATAGDSRPPARARLDVAAATRLAEEARRRERATRAALEAERAALMAAPLTASDPPTVASPTTASIEAELPASRPRGWRTLAIPTADLLSPETGKEESRLLRHTLEEQALEEQALHEQEQAPAERDRRLVEAEAGIAAAHQEIARLQQELATERRERSAVEEILRRLRHELTQLDPQPGDQEAGVPSGPEERTVHFEPLPGIRAEGTSTSGVTTPRTGPLRPRVFDVWQDAQIRRHFGPLGIDCFVDLVRRPVARRARSGGDPIRILLIGRGAWQEAARLASGLVQREPAPFQIHVADPFDPDAEGQRALGHENPLRDLIRAFALPPSPEVLASRLASLEPELLVSSHFLSAQTDPSVWLEAFEGLRAKGHALIFAERTGAAIPPPTSEIAKIGERIWARMPDRYKCQLDSGAPIPSWREALETSEAMHANGCLDALRTRFDFELFAPFGHLAEPFIGSGIGSRFSVGAPRDLRFLTQVADVDDRQIEAGIAPALHFVALVDPGFPNEPVWAT